MKKRYALLLVFGLVAMAASSPASDYTFTTVEFPGAEATTVTGISGSTVIGTYYNTNGGSGAFIYDGSTFTTLDNPALPGMTPTGISGGTIVGHYEWVTNGAVAYRSFIYNGSTFATLDVPGALQTVALGISGGTVFGWFQYTNAGGAHGFLYNGSTFTTLDYPGSPYTKILGICGGTVAGINNGPDPFTYNGSTFTTLDFPDGSVLPERTITGISGSTVVGYYQPGPAIQFFGFVYDGSAVTTLVFPGAWTTEIMGVSGNTVFGTGFNYYYDEDDDLVAYGPGFVAQLEIPAPRISLTTSNTIVISWPYPSTGWNLQQNSDLTTTNWVTPSEAVAYNGTNDFINVGRPPGNLFFRLSHP